MATISSIAIDFIANVANYTAGLDTMSKKTKTWSGNTKKDTKAATDGFDATGKSIANLAKGLGGLIAIQQVGAAFANVAKEVSLLADEAEKVGASAGQFDKLRLAAERNGSEIGTVKIAYKELQKSINEALTGTKATADAFNDLGLSYKSISELSPDKQFEKIVDALSRVDDANKRAELGTKLLGKSYVELSPLIAKGLGGLEVGGRGALNDEQVATIDKVTKSFEEVARVIDGKLKEALIALAPALTSIASALTFIIENFGKLALIIGVAFSAKPIELFQRGLQKLIGSLYKYAAAYKGIKFNPVGPSGPLPLPEGGTFRQGGEIARSASGKKVKLPDRVLLPSTTPKIIQKTSEGLQLLAGRAATLLGVLSTVATVAAKITATVGISIEIGFGVGQLLANVADGMAATEERLGRGSEGVTKFRESLKQYKNAVIDIRTVFRESVLEFFGFDTQAKKTKEFLAGSGERIAAAQQRETERAAQAVLAAQEKQTTAAKEEAKKMLEAITTFGASTTKDVMTPFEKADAEFNKLTLALDIGTITISNYFRAVEKLRDSLNSVDLAKLRDVYQGGPFGALGTSYKVPGIPEEQRFSQETQRAEMFGAGTFVSSTTPMGFGQGIGLPKGMTLPSIDINDDEKKRIEDLGKALTEEGRSAKEVYNQRIKDIEAASIATDKYGNAILSAEGKTYALNEATKKFGIDSTEAYIKSNEEIFKFVALTDDLASGFGNAIAAGQSFGEALRNVFQDLTKQIIAMILRSIILQSILAAIGVVAPAGSQAPAAFAAMMNIKPMAKGGPVSANNPLLVGEVGPELFVPRSNGIIVPNDMMGRESTQVVQNIYVQTGVAQTVRAEMAALLPTFKQQAIAGVVEAKQRGGSYARALSPA